MYFANVFEVDLYFSYKNRPMMTFDDIGCDADQEFELHPDPSGVLEYATK